MKLKNTQKLTVYCLLALLLLSVCGSAMAQEGTAGLTLPEDRQGFADRLSDNNTLTRVPLAAGEQLSLQLDEAAHGLTLKWQCGTAAYHWIQYDKTGAVLSEGQSEAGFLNRYHELLPDCRTVTLELTEAAELCEAAWYAAALPLPQEAQRWQSLDGFADLLVVAASPGEELGMLGGLLPLYTVEHEIKTAVVFLNCGKRLYAEEALDALWRLGIRTYPLFLEDIPLSNPDSEQMVELEWKNRNRLRDKLIELIRMLHPRVAVTGGLHPDASPAARFAAEMLTVAAEGAMLPKWSRSSAEAYGLWQLDKVYVQGAGSETDPATRLDGAAQLVSAGGISLEERTAYAYAAYRSQVKYHRAVEAGAGFTLTFSTVGDDTAGDDLWEHIDTASLISYAQPTPMPSATPLPAPALTPVPASALTLASASVTPAPAAQKEQPGLPVIAVLALGLILSAALLLILIKRLAPNTKKRAWFCLVPLGCALMVSAALMLTAGEAKPKQPAAVDPTSSPAALPTLTQTPEPTPTPSPTPEPTPEPKWHDMFRREGEPEEVIAADDEAGYWSYKTDTLGLFVDRRLETLPDGLPLTYFVAHIYMRDVQEFRPIFGSAGRTGRGATMPWIMARRARTALLVSGDNMVNMEKELKGIIIRDGLVFSENKAEDVIALYPDMSLRIFSPREITASELLCAGVENVFSFGPTLIRDGVVNDKAMRHRLRARNPRVGIGMVEPGHLVMIAVDGRDAQYSIGVTLSEFTEIFLRENCVEAYNLDGGASVAILFMGEQINYHANHPGDMQRPIPDGLAWGYSRLVPTEFDPVANKGVHGQ